MIKPQVVLAAALLLSGCARPYVIPNEPQGQYKVEAGQHWQALATRTADRLALALREIPDIDPGRHIVSGGRIQAAKLGARTYYIHAPALDMPFAKAFTPMLQQALAKEGYSVSRTPTNSVVVNYSVETYYYGGENRIKKITNYASLYTTAIGLGLLASTDSWSRAGGGLAALGSGPVLDLLIASGEITNSEVVMTTSVVDGHSVLYQDTEVFYANPADLPLYWSEFPTSAPMETEERGPPPLRVSRIPIGAI